MKPLIVKCPCCGIELDIDRESGKLVRIGPKPGEKQGVERFDDIVSGVKQKTKQGASAFDKAREAVLGREKEAEDAFGAAVRKVKGSGDTGRPVNPLDLD